ncbi:hypothetical protein [Bradyrhizobium sp. USDA 3650]
MAATALVTHVVSKFAWYLPLQVQILAGQASISTGRRLPAV